MKSYATINEIIICSSLDASFYRLIVKDAKSLSHFQPQYRLTLPHSPNVGD